MSLLYSESTFEDSGLNDKLIGQLQGDKGGFAYQFMTNVQKQVIPFLVSSSHKTKNQAHAMIKSQTGSGKSIAYLSPILHSLMSITPPIQRTDGTRALIIVPTRELCVQVSEVLTQLSKVCVNIVVGSISGGEKKKSEKERLRKGVVILICTPGRLIDHLQTTESFNLNRLSWLVLDEADRLLDMGFEKSIQSILSYIHGTTHVVDPLKDTDVHHRMSTKLTNRYARKQSSKHKQCLDIDQLRFVMCSATVGSNVQHLAHTIMHTYTFFDADSHNKGDGAGGKAGEVKERAVVDNSLEKERTIEADDNDGKCEDTRSRYIDHDNTTGNEQHTAPSYLKQYFITVPSRWRLAALVAFLKEHTHDKIIVFFSTCDSVDFHTLLFREATWPQSLYHQEYDDIIARHTSNNHSNGSISHNSSHGNDKGDDAFTLDYNGSFGANKQGSFQNGKDAQQTKILPPLRVINPCNLCNRHPKATGHNNTNNKTTSHHHSSTTSDLSIYRLHGSMSQEERKEVFNAFHNASSGLLFCTDVAARGLDLPDIHWILQYDPPCDIDDYVHRCGRTARKGMVGKSLLFLLPSEAKYTQLLYTRGLLIEPLSLTKMLSDAIDYAMTTSTNSSKRKSKNEDELLSKAITRNVEAYTHHCLPLLLAARQAMRSFLRAYTAHSKELKDVFNVKLLNHLHVCRSFGLKEEDVETYKHEDVIKKIQASHFTEEYLGIQRKEKADRKKVEKRKNKDKDNKDKSGSANKGGNASPHSGKYEMANSHSYQGKKRDREGDGQVSGGYADRKVKTLSAGGYDKSKKRKAFKATAANK
jgi:ATP-dependent RNA helicase DDX31/DBP7